MPRWVIPALTLALAAAPAAAERLPVKTYSTADGLAQDTVNRVVQDSLGFLWFCTDGGLSRFDGYRFANFTKSDGLPSNQVVGLLEARDHTYWVATSGGLSHLDPAARPSPEASSEAPVRLVTIPLGGTGGENQVLSLAEEPDGAVLAGTVSGLFRLTRNGTDWHVDRIETTIPPDLLEGVQFNALLADGQGGFWWATRRAGLYHRGRDGLLAHLPARADGPSANIRGLSAGPDGTLWAATRDGLIHVARDGSSSELRLLARVTEKDGLPTSFTSDVLRARDGRIYVATPIGLAVVELDGESLRVRTLGTAEGLTESYINNLAQDRNGNLWLGTYSRGAMKLLPGGFVSYEDEPSATMRRYACIFESRRGDLLSMITTDDRRILLSRFDGSRFVPFPLNMPRLYTGWGWHQLALQDRSGEWWVPTGEGLYRFAATDDLAELSRARPKAVYRSGDGIGTDDVFRLFEDSRGDLWMSAWGLVRWDRATGTFHRYEGVRAVSHVAVGSFAEDRAGNLWISIWGGGLVRHHDGLFVELTSADGLPAGTVTVVKVDGKGRLWVATDEGGVACTDDPSAEHPVFRIYALGQGLSSNEVRNVIEDRFGRIYLCTGRGVDRLDPETDRIKHFTTADGLIINRLELAYTDRRGDLWFASHLGFSRLTPELDPPKPPPPVLISSLRVAGLPRWISPLGAPDQADLTLAPGERQLEVEFAGLDFSPGEVLRYQFRLVGADAGWSAPSERRAVNYANLAPGRYRFLVRAIDSAGQTSPEPAAVSFEVLPPIWRRWWFVAITGLAFAGAVAAVLRYRISRLIELERVRTRIATDLHDDIGASLSQIAILSEVTRRRAGGADPAVASSLEKIAGVSGELVDSMSDIVWAINPRRDRLSDLTQRMRWFASDLLASRDFRLEFSAPDTDRDIHLDADVRRQLYLVFKEALNNLVKHSGGSSARIELKRDDDRIVLRVADDGSGFDPAAPRGGHGLASMNGRARAVGGSLRIASRPGHGTELTLEVPLVRRRMWRRDPPLSG